MAERFPDFQVQEIQELRQNSENQNTKKSTTTWLNVWAESKNFETNLLSYEGKQVDETLQKFFAEIRKKDGSEYEPDSFKSYVGVIGPTPERKGYCLLNS